MGTRGDLLALVDGAPGRLKTLQAALTTWTHRARVAEVNRRSAAEGLGHPDDPVPGGPVGGAALSVVALGGDDEPAESLSTAYAVVALPDRWRVVGRGHLAVSDGRRSWAGTSTLVTERDSARAAIFDAGAIGACLYPGTLLRGLDFSDPEVDDIEGRPCWYVAGSPRPGGPATADWPDLRVKRELVGIDHRIWFDADCGIVLRHEGSIDGELCSTTALSDLVFDQPVREDEFRPPPGAVVRSRHELLRDHLASLGVDPDTVDLDDPAQVRAALRGE
jgi:hypothetical protein